MVVARYIGSPGKERDCLAATQQYLAQERAKHVALIRDLRHRSAKRVKRTWQRARERGFACGKQEALEEFGRTLDAVEALFRKTVLAAEKDILDLVVTIAESVIGSELKVQSETLAKRISREIATLSKRSEIRILVHPHDLEVTREQLNVLIPGLEIKLSTASEIERGDAVILTPAGTLTLSVTKHLDGIRKELLSSAAPLE